jgi:hypothetical protein
MEQKIITAYSASDLNETLVKLLKEGWKPIGPHQVVETHHQMRFAGMQHKDTTINREYSLSVQRENTPSEGQKLVVDAYVEDLTEILETKTDDVEDIKNLRTATIKFLSILKEKEDKILKP